MTRISMLLATEYCLGFMAWDWWILAVAAANAAALIWIVHYLTQRRPKH